MTDLTIPPPRERVRAQVPLWFSVLAGPAAWGIQLGVSYLIVPHVCASGQVLWLHLLTVVAALIAASSLLVGIRLRRHANAADPAQDVAERNGFFGLSGIVLSGLFLVVVLFTGLQSILINPCL